MVTRIPLLLLAFAVCLVGVRSVAQQDPGDRVAARPGYIQVKCDPGVALYLDGRHVGVSTDDLGGWVIENVPPGSHLVTGVKKGFRPKETRVTLSAGDVRVIRLGPFVERAPVQEEDGQASEPAIGQRTGTLVIRTVPVDCQLRIPQLGINSEKSSAVWRGETIPEGTYEVEVSSLGRTLKQAVTVVPGGTVEMLFNVLRGNVEVVADKAPAEIPTAEGLPSALPERIEALDARVKELKRQLEEARQGLKTADLNTPMATIRDLVERRDRLDRLYSDMNYELKVLRQRRELESERSQREEVVSRHKRFVQEYAVYRQLEDDLDISSAVKLNAWNQLCRRWDVDPGDEPGRLLWDERTGRPYKVISQMLPIGGGVEMELVRIKGGAFEMGSEQGENDEQPVHSVSITRPFWMGKYEVTQLQYETVTGTNPSHFEGSSRPVENVSWRDANAFCEKLTERERNLNRLPDGYEYRLPSEAEWEYCCRAGSTAPFSFGEQLDETMANFDTGYGKRLGHSAAPHRETLPVGSFRANTWDLYDMHGNVWEWCLDWYDREYYSRSPRTDPMNRRPSSFRACRGGSWVQPASFARSANRNYGDATKGNHMTGFRVVLAPIPGVTLP